MIFGTLALAMVGVSVEEVVCFFCVVIVLVGCKCNAVLNQHSLVPVVYNCTYFLSGARRPDSI